VHYGQDDYPPAVCLENLLYPCFQGLYNTMSEPSREVVELFFAVADVRENISKKSIASYVISMTRQASHVMEVCSSHLFFASSFFNFHLLF
jgi:hypothetical protein